MKNSFKQYSNKVGTKQRGATLIETMVSLFVFAVGALGIAAMQTTSLVRVDDTKQRSIAIWKLQELADKIRLTKTRRNPNGLVAEYIAEINNNSDDIGKTTAANIYNCGAVPAQRCEDMDGDSAATCNAAQLVTFDVWSMMCDPNSGLQAASADGAVGLRDVELAAVQADGEVRLYLEWANRSSNNDSDLQTNAKDVKTDLCGVETDVDARLDAYCLRFQ